MRPPLVGREAPPAWRAVWRFRLAALVVLGLLALAAVLLIRVLTGATAQDPGVETLPSAERHVEAGAGPA